MKKWQGPSWARTDGVTVQVRLLFGRGGEASSGSRETVRQAGRGDCPCPRLAEHARQREPTPWLGNSLQPSAAPRPILPACLACVLRLLLLVPALVEAVLNGRHDPQWITLEWRMRQFSTLWKEQQDDM